LNPILEVRHLTKSFGSHKAVDDLSFSVIPGDVYGFLGENGAGKSTTLRTVLGLIRPSSGEVYIGGEPFPQAGRRLLRRVGAVVERPDLYGYLSGRENLRLFADLCDPAIPGKRLDEVLELVGLSGRDKDRVKGYSLGMKQRLGIAVALVHDPDLLILDEPTNGLDPQGIADMRELIRHLSRDRSKTVVVSSHLLHEIEQVATRLLILHKGKKVVEGPMEELFHPDETTVVVDITPDSLVADAVKASSWNASLKEDATDNTLRFTLHPDRIPELTSWLVANGAAVRGIRARHSLEDLFLSLTP
jgi:ABC-type multidrug transport system ATPase subunit